MNATTAKAKLISHEGQSKDAHIALTALRTVNAPVISESDFARLYKGELAEIIDLLAHSVVGRSATNSARGMIQLKRDSSTHTTPLSHQDTDPLYSAAIRADSQLKNARILVENEKKTRTDYSHKVRDLEHEQYKLRASLQDKRVTSLLLAILERKEKIRQERFAEVAKLLESLRQKSKTTNKVAIKSEPLSLKATLRPVRTDYTKDVLSALQAHSLRVGRLSAQANLNGQSSSSRVEEAEQRLLQAVTRPKGSDVNDADVSSTYQQLLASARNQALHRVRYRSPIPADREIEDIGEVAQRISDKEEELQRLADQSAALTLACAQALQVVSHFTKEATPALRVTLQDEADAAQRHVDTLRLSVVNRPRSSPGRPPGESLGGGQTLSATISTLERTVMRGLKQPRLS
ncbi:hypothetical protein K466DRAFT_605937 [Polyporus arcularius HHB13444]|uniref:Uncharacterized protein n=1 Tax=Polyporus arcularius HHB13444 TaxID=1314778 RepID=A0A5C3NQ76_9APHY|nr:hypothetical protein K466DRAFT_605937 [Polyporus arcularius HHB13444]